ncbi:MAG: FIST N-terminal domain-containing protein [Cyanobacteriota bacterium]
MSVKIAYSTNTSSKEASQEIKEKFSNENNLKLVLFFASSNYDPNEIAAEMQNNFSSLKTFGCTTSGELISGLMLKNSIVAMAFSDDLIEDFSVEVLDDLNKKDAVDLAFKNFESHYESKMQEMDFKKYVGLTLIDGLSLAEEKIIDRIGDLTNIPFVGGSTGDDLKFTKTHVFYNGKAFSNSAILALLKPKVDFDIIKTQSFKALDKKLIPTKINSETRTVYEFNNIPAVKAYTDLIGIDINDASKYFMHHPLGLMANDEPFVRSPQQTKDDAMVFYCNVSENMELSLLESGNIVDDTKRDLDLANQKRKIKSMINFNCILRTLELEAKDQTEAYGKVFEDIPTIGFSTYGEQYLGHINQTSTILVFY